MGTSYLTGTYMYWRSQYTIRMQLFYQHTYSHNIRNGIHRSYLMKMNLRYFSAMHLTLCFCNQTIYSSSMLFHTV